MQYSICKPAALPLVLSGIAKKKVVREATSRSAGWRCGTASLRRLRNTRPRPASHIRADLPNLPRATAGNWRGPGAMLVGSPTADRAEHFSTPRRKHPLEGDGASAWPHCAATRCPAVVAHRTQPPRALAPRQPGAAQPRDGRVLAELYVLPPTRERGADTGDRQKTPPTASPCGVLLRSGNSPPAPSCSAALRSGRARLEPKRLRTNSKL